MKRDVHTEITEKFVAMIEASLASGDRWAMPWLKAGGLRRPINHTTGKSYRGINVPMLWGSAQQGSFQHDRWASFNQWRNAGAMVRKGEKGTPVVFYKKLSVTDKATGEAKEIPMVRLTHVFNIGQVDGAEAPALLPVETLTDRTARLAAADAFIANTGARIEHAGERAFFAPSVDLIRMPERSRFIGETQQATEGYYSTLLHELTHWTGHTARLDRLEPAAFGSKTYAFEELVAELGAAFLCADLGVTNEPRDDHAHYLASWLQGLKEDSRAIFRAAAAADRACDYLKGLQGAAPAADTGDDEDDAQALAA